MSGDEITIEKLRRAYGFAGRKIRELKLKSVSVQAFESNLAGIKLPESSQAMVEGILLSHYRLDRYKTDAESKPPALLKLTFWKEKRKGIGEVKQGVTDGEISSWATNLSRDLANRPGNYLTPTRLASEADQLARQNNFECTVFHYRSNNLVKCKEFSWLLRVQGVNATRVGAYLE